MTNDPCASEPVTPGPQQLSDDPERLATRYTTKSFLYARAGLLLLLADGTVIAGNPSLGRMLGYAPDHLRHMSLYALVHPDDLLLCAHHMSQLLAGQLHVYEAELRFVRSNGETFQTMVTGYDMWDEAGGCRLLHLEIHAIDALRRTELALRENVSFNHQLLNALPGPYILLGRDWRFLRINKAGEALIGRAMEDVEGRTLWSVFPGSVNTPLHLACEQAMEEQTAVVTYDMFGLSGAPFEIACCPCKPGLSLFFYDRTRQLQQERQLAGLHMQLSSMIELSADTVAFLDKNFRLIQVNDTFIDTFGYSREELIGKTPPYIPEWLGEEAATLFRQALEGRKVSGFETKRLRKDGALLDLSLTISPIVGPAGQVESICMIGRDISERKKTEERLLHSEKLSVAGQLAAGIAHEIRNPLTALKGFTQILQTGSSYSSHYLDIMLSELTRIEQIVNELLLIARPQAASFKRSDIGPILHDVVSLLESQAHMHNIAIDVEIPAGLLPVHCDENQLKQVFINLLKNAIEALPRGGRIHISASMPKTRTLAVVFRDNGEGIPGHVLKRLGEPFYTTKEAGSGLGLTISQKIIHEHKGLLNVSSLPGQGTTVMLTLPAETGDSAS